MLRDNLAGLIEPMRAARELNPLALFTEQKKSSDDRPQDALKIPAPKGRNLTLTENAASPFHAEPKHPNGSVPRTAEPDYSDEDPERLPPSGKNERAQRCCVLRHVLQR